MCQIGTPLMTEQKKAPITLEDAEAYVAERCGPNENGFVLRCPCCETYLALFVPVPDLSGGAVSSPANSLAE